MKDYAQLLRLFKLIQKIDINNKIENGNFIFEQKTRKVLKFEIDRLSTIVQQSLPGSEPKGSTPKSKQPIETLADDQQDIPKEFADVINKNFDKLL